ncbi:MAG: KEOPS complex subunit Pcc1 [Candidatus Diapherotrites archaeon]
MQEKFLLEARFVFPSEKNAETALKAISIDKRDAVERRSKTSMQTNKNILTLKIKAGDPTALKASANSCIKLISLVGELCE